MNDVARKDRLLPSLLDRLTDLEPGAKHEPRERRLLSMRALRVSVQRDLGWLFNASALCSAQDASRYPLVMDSVLNFGFPDIAGKTADGIDTAALEESIRRLVQAFEPRIVAETLRVTGLGRAQPAQHNTLSFLLEGDLWGEPFPERLYLRTELDLESGDVRVSEDLARYKS
ncbi:hypothetical protein BTHE68_56760 [Burkholderia sp. THE68]|uniref:type VI secretion system baseplate subunit TssE n=1 Tax=Burkholderia sp. THE68 TaxID=758782 RepID=UPI001317B7AB|nr:type VI secretion system baseplate subunit TssE [Burkholderia sp. THE68]BBU31942.1 hypothetical protein BTHE68_56760 [Burkholderia sp. THE68]